MITISNHTQSKIHIFNVYIIPQLLQIFVNQKVCIMKIKGPFMRVVLWKETIEHPFVKPKLKNGICNDTVQIS
jgi:hypothetical protein